MTRADVVREIARREALADAWVASAKTLRDDLERQARDEYERERTGISWPVPDLGTVALPLSKEAPVISDIAALLKWVEAERPDQVIKQVRATFQTWLVKNAVITPDGDVVLVGKDGKASSPIPGMGFRRAGKPGTLTFRFNQDAKDLFAEYARQEVMKQLAAKYGPATPAQPEPEPPEFVKHKAGCAVWDDDEGRFPCTCGAEGGE